MRGAGDRDHRRREDDEAGVCGSGGTGSAHQRQVHFGLGSAAAVDELEVLWPSGVRQIVDDVAVDQMISIDERCA